VSAGENAEHERKLELKSGKKIFLVLPKVIKQESQE
jgi:hypothetical protein